MEVEVNTGIGNTIHEEIFRNVNRIEMTSDGFISIVTTLPDNGLHITSYNPQFVISVTSVTTNRKEKQK